MTITKLHHVDDEVCKCCLLLALRASDFQIQILFCNSLLDSNSIRNLSPPPLVMESEGHDIKQSPDLQN
jgi:hypothetical protein